MPRIRAFDGYLVDPAHAVEVVSPAYDAVSPQMRREFADAHPRNYINTMRLLADFPADAQPTVDELLAYNKANLDALLSGGAFNRIEKPCLFIYQLATDTHCQTGVVCEVSVDEYAHGRLRKHENTRSDKEDLLALYQRVVGVSSSPICLAHAHDDGVERALAELTAAPPALDFVSGDGVAQRVWRIDDAAAQRRLQDLFARIDTTYLTDGHHRAAAGWRYAQMRRGGGDVPRHPRSLLSGGAGGDGGGVGDSGAGGGDGDGAAGGGDGGGRGDRGGAGDGGAGDGERGGDERGDRGGDGGDAEAPYNQLLVALFSARQLNLLPFHRAVADLNGLSEAQLVAALRRDFSVQPVDGDAFQPSRHGEFGMLLGKNAGGGDGGGNGGKREGGSSGDSAGGGAGENGDENAPENAGKNGDQGAPENVDASGDKSGDKNAGASGDESGDKNAGGGGRWYRLRARSGLVDPAHPVDSLDVSILQNHILAPIFGITDARGDPRLDYVSGVSGPAALRRKCADGWPACFAIYPTSIAQLMKVADANGLMPPKSTYFDPKARSGIFIRPK